MQKPRLSFWQIWNMSFGFLGIQFGWGLQIANMSPIYRSLDAEESSLPYLWLAGPITARFSGAGQGAPACTSRRKDDQSTSS